jgi:hypothetical protein
MNIWTSGGGRVATMAPGPDDVLVVTTVAGRRVSLHTVDDYGHALNVAEAAAVRMAPVPVTIKVFCLTLIEAQAFGLVPSDLCKNQTPKEEAETRELVVTTLWNLLQNGSEAKVRSQAWRMLKDLGEVK